MADAGKMYPDLMGPPSFQLTFNISITAEPLKNLKVSHRLLASPDMNSHFLPFHRMTPNGSFYSTIIFFEISMDNRSVFSGNAVDLQLLCQALMSRVSLADY